MDPADRDQMYSSGSEHSLMQFEVMLGNNGRFNLDSHRAVNLVI